MRAGAADERVVLRNRSVGVDAQHLAHVAVELLRLRPVDRVDAEAGRNRGRDEQRAVGRLNQPSAGAFGVQQHLHVLEPLVVGRQLRAARPAARRGCAAARPGFAAVRQHGVGEIDRAVRRERPIRPDLEQALAAAAHMLAGMPVERLRDLAVLADDPDAARRARRR